MQTLEQIHTDHPTPDTQPPSHETLYPSEIRRWMLLFGLPMLVACVCIALSFRIRWFYAGTIAFGPGLGVLAIIFLAISSDTNGTATPAPAITGSAASERETAPASAAA